MLNIYLLTQDKVSGYDTFDGLIVTAESEYKAKQIKPPYSGESAWPKPEYIHAELIGEADPKIKEAKIILESFNAG